MNKKIKKNKSFTLIELMMVVAIISILAGAIFVAIDPVRRFAEARNAERWSNTTALLGAIMKYQIDNDGEAPTVVSDLTPGFYYQLGTETAISCANTCTQKTVQAECKDLTSALVDYYIHEIPKDPKTGTDLITDYYIIKSTTGRITIGACEPEAEGGVTPDIKVSAI
jgi:prepilin-type N-terminal cleavage/methylation domain-containing protein